jgi:hypothetical protein
MVSIIIPPHKKSYYLIEKILSAWADFTTRNGSWLVIAAPIITKKKSDNFKYSIFYV